MCVCVSGGSPTQACAPSDANHPRLNSPSRSRLASPAQPDSRRAASPALPDSRGNTQGFDPPHGSSHPPSSPQTVSPCLFLDHGVMHSPILEQEPWHEHQRAVEEEGPRVGGSEEEGGSAQQEHLGGDSLSAESRYASASVTDIPPLQASSALASVAGKPPLQPSRAPLPLLPRPSSSQTGPKPRSTSQSPEPLILKPSTAPTGARRSGSLRASGSASGRRNSVHWSQAASPEAGTGAKVQVGQALHTSEFVSLLCSKDLVDLYRHHHTT